MTALAFDSTPALDAIDDYWRTRPCGYDGRPRRNILGTDRDQNSATVNPYWEIARRLPVEELDWRQDNRVWVEPHEVRSGVGYPALRTALTRDYAWAIPTPLDLAWMVWHLDGRGVVEIGAGAGYWAWQLDQFGVDVLAVDNNVSESNHFISGHRWFPVRPGGTEVAARHPERALLLCWPPYADSMATRALRAYRGDMLFWVGEPEGGRTGDDRFFQVLGAGWERVEGSPGHATFVGIDCSLALWRRKGTAA